jgi:hypothetical protein
MILTVSGVTRPCLGTPTPAVARADELGTVALEQERRWEALGTVAEV